MRAEAVHQRRDLVLLPDAAEGADQSIRVTRQWARTRASRGHAAKCGVQGVDRHVGPARERKVEIVDVIELAFRQTVGRDPWPPPRLPVPRHIAFPQSAPVAFAAWAREKLGIG